MGLKSTLKRVAKAMPAIIAAAPALADAVRGVRAAVRKPKKGVEPRPGNAAPGE